MTTYTPLWRLAVMTPLDPAVKGSWGAVQDATMPLMEQGAVGNSPISIDGLTTYTLTTANNAADQGRLAMYNFTGTLAGDCTVTIPNIARIGWATNSTSGGKNVILTTGGGTTLTIGPGFTYFWTCDGTNIATTTWGNTTVGGTLIIPQAAAASTQALRADQAWQEIATYVLTNSTTQAIPLSSSFKRFRLTLQRMTVWTADAALTLVLSSDSGSTYHASNYAYAISGLFTDGTTYGPIASKVGTAILVSPALNSNSAGFDVVLDIYPGGSGVRAGIHGRGFGLASGSQYARIEIGATWDSTTGAQNYMRLGATTGNIGGTIILEGLP